MPQEENKAIAGVLQAGAELTLQAKTRMQRYRVTLVKVSNTTGDVCCIGEQALIDAVTREQAKQEFLKNPESKIPDNDVVGTWECRAFKINLGE